MFCGGAAGEGGKNSGGGLGVGGAEEAELAGGEEAFGLELLAEGADLLFESLHGGLLGAEALVEGEVGGGEDAGQGEGEDEEGEAEREAHGLGGARRERS